MWITRSWSRSTARLRKDRSATARLEIVGTETTCCTGNPDPRHISTSYAERQNLSMRMGMRRFTRLTNAFSKKVENHAHAISIYFMHYNFVRIHQTLRVTPAMAAGVTDRLWEMSDLVAMIDDARRSPKAAGGHTGRKPRRFEMTVVALLQTYAQRIETIAGSMPLFQNRLLRPRSSNFWKGCSHSYPSPRGW